GRALGDALLVERVGLARAQARLPARVVLAGGHPGALEHARWPALERGRTVAGGAQDPLADRQEVLHELPLGVAVLREVDLVGIGHLDEPIPDRDLDEGRGHDGTLTHGPDSTGRAATG